MATANERTAFGANILGEHIRLIVGRAFERILGWWQPNGVDKCA